MEKIKITAGLVLMCLFSYAQNDIEIAGELMIINTKQEVYNEHSNTLIVKDTLFVHYGCDIFTEPIVTLCSYDSFNPSKGKDLYKAFLIGDDLVPVPEKDHRAKARFKTYYAVRKWRK